MENVFHGLFPYFFDHHMCAFFGPLELIFGGQFIFVREVMGEGECVLYALCI